MKGSERNTQCPCGSGKKRKKCGPHLTEAEMNELHDAANLENHWRTPEGAQELLSMQARSRRRAQMVIALSGALSV